MSFDAFIKIDGIEGESNDKRYVGWIEVLLFKAKVSQKSLKTASSVGGASAGRADFSALEIVKQVDKASPILAMACAAGKHFDTVVLELCRAGTEKIKYMEYKLSNCMISEVAVAVEKDFPAELLRIDYGAIQWSYFQQMRQGGSIAGHVAAGWNLQRNCRL